MAIGHVSSDEDQGIRGCGRMYSYMENQWAPLFSIGKSSHSHLCMSHFSHNCVFFITRGYGFTLWWNWHVCCLLVKIGGPIIQKNNKSDVGWWTGICGGACEPPWWRFSCGIIKTKTSWSIRSWSFMVIKIKYGAKYEKWKHDIKSVPYLVEPI